MKAGEAVRIMTGAPVPAGADSVQQVELTRENNLECRNSRASRTRSIDCNGKPAKSNQAKPFCAPAKKSVRAMIATLASFGYAKVKVSAASPSVDGDGYRQRAG